MIYFFYDIPAFGTVALLLILRNKYLIRFVHFDWIFNYDCKKQWKVKIECGYGIYTPWAKLEYYTS